MESAYLACNFSFMPYVDSHSRTQNRRFDALKQFLGGLDNSKERFDSFKQFLGAIFALDVSIVVITWFYIALLVVATVIAAPGLLWGEIILYLNCI